MHGGEQIAVRLEELTMRCKLERCVSGMKRTGWMTWSSRVLKKVHSFPTELLTNNLEASKTKDSTIIYLLTSLNLRGNSQEHMYITYCLHH